MCRCRHDQSEHVDGSDMIPRLLAKGGEHVDGALQHLLKVRARPRVRIRVRKGLELRVRVGVGVRVRGWVRGWTMLRSTSAAWLRLW